MSDAAEIARFERALARKSGANTSSKKLYGAAAAAQLPEEEKVAVRRPLIGFCCVFLFFPPLLFFSLDSKSDAAWLGDRAWHSVGGDVP